MEWLRKSGEVSLVSMEISSVTLLNSFFKFSFHLCVGGVIFLNFCLIGVRGVVLNRVIAVITSVRFF